jgi:hypothetical protein
MPNETRFCINWGGGQSCPQPAFSRLLRPKKAAAAKIGRPPIYAECSDLENYSALRLSVPLSVGFSRQFRAVPLRSILTKEAVT